MRRLAMLIVMVAGCAHAPATTPTPTTTATTTTSKKPLTVHQRLDNVTTSIEKRDFQGALRDTDEWLAEKPEPDIEGLIYNCRTWIRWASGDKKGAFAENEKIPPLVARTGDKTKSSMLHYWWDRSYLEAEAGKLDEAQKSRDQFFAIATKPDDADSKHVLDAWLAFRRGDGEKARTEASAVDPAKDGDLQDLYVLACALDAGGDAAGAASVRERIRNGPRYGMKPTILQQMERDGASRCQ